MKSRNITLVFGFLSLAFIYAFAEASLITKIKNHSTKGKNTDEELKEVKIGTQVWSTKNLNVGHFRNGKLIPQAKSREEWIKAGKDKSPAWCYHEYKKEFGATYGRFYNWHALKDARHLAPKGWHIPNEKEWDELIFFLGGNEIAGEKLKALSGWPGIGNGTNEVGFNSLPAGHCSEDGLFSDFSQTGEFWIANYEDMMSAKVERQFVSVRDEKLNKEVTARDIYSFSVSESEGFPVRCVKD